MSRRVKYVAQDGRLAVVTVEPTAAQRAAARRNGLKGGRPRKAGTGPQRRISVSADAALNQIVDGREDVATVGEALDLLLGEKSVKIVIGLLTRKPNSAINKE